MARPPIPAPDHEGKWDAGRIAAFLDHVLRHDTAYRILRYRIWELCRLYLQSEQWVEPDYTEDVTRSPFFKPMEVDGTNWTAMPVQNEMVAPIQNEVARLMGQGSRPYVRPDNDAPQTVKACKLGKDVLQDRLEKLAWTEVEHEGSHGQALYGTWVIRSASEIDYTKTKPVPRKTALRCASCDFTMAEPAIPDERAEAFLASRPDAVAAQVVEPPNNEFLPRTVKASAKGCLTCPPRREAVTEMIPETGHTVPAMDEFGQPIVRDLGPEPLQPFVPTREQAESGTDHFGRRLGEDLPSIETTLRNVPLFDYFPQNGGLNVTQQSCQEWGEEHVESLDWITAHYENGGLVKPEDASTLMRWHPIVGGSHYYFGGGMGPDVSMFDTHSRVREWHKAPWRELQPDGTLKLNRGRSFVMSNGVVLLAGDFLIESRRRPGRFIPRVHYDSSPWEIRLKEIFGIGAGELMLGTQDIINTLLAQVQDARHRFGSPKLLAAEGMDLTYAGFADTGYNSDIWYYRPIEGAQDVQPEPFGNEQMDAQWTQELDRYVDSIARIVGTMDVEIGNDPGFDAASALMFMGEKAAERRKPRIARNRALKRRVFRDQLLRISEFYTDEQLYHVKGKNNRDEVKAFRGVDLLDQIDVQLEDEPSYDVRLVQRQNLKVAHEMGSLHVDTEHAAREVNKVLEIPPDINGEKNLQIDSAESEWVRFLEEDRDPVIHQREDAHVLHFETHVRDWMSQDGIELRDAVGFDQVELALWGWEDEFLAIQAIEAELKANPPKDPTQGAPPIRPDGTPDIEGAKHAIEVYQQRMEQQAMIAKLPKAIELRLLAIWGPMLLKAGIDPEAQPVLKKLLRWKAHYEGHYQEGRAQAQAAAAGAAMPAPPASPETPQGMVPTAGQATVPGAGAGPGAETASGSGVAA
jgi:hypothetical protein